MKKILIFIMLVMLSIAVQANTGNVYHEIQVKDETGKKVTDISSVLIYLPDTTTNATIYADRALTQEITLPMTTSSTNTTLSNGYFYWYGPDGWDFSITDGTNISTNANHRTRTSSEGTLIFPSYLQSISTLTLTDAQSHTYGTGSDWVANGGAVANTMQWTPAADNSAFNIGTSGTTLNSDFNVWVGTAVGFKLDAGVPSLTWDGGAANINASSNFTTNINTGTSTGAINIGSSTAGAIAVDTTSTVAVNADDSVDVTTTGASADIDIDATAGSVIIDGGEAAADAVTITATTALGGIDITSNADIDITTTGAAGEDITLTNTGGSVNITATEADAGAIIIQATAAGGDLNLDSVLGRIEIEAEEDVANALYLIADGGTSSTLEIFNDTGTSVTEGAAAVQVLADVGGVAIQSNADLDDAIVIIADGGTTAEISIHNDQGTATDSIEIVSDDGGITLNSDDAIGITMSGDIVKNYLKEIEVETGTSETVLAADSGKVFTNTAGQGTTTFTLPTAAAGLVFTFVDISATAADDVWITAGAGDTINSGTAAKSYKNTADAIPASVTLVAVSAASWEIVAEVGAGWANDNN